MEEDLKKKQEYLKMIYDYLENRGRMSVDEVNSFYAHDLQGEAPGGCGDDNFMYMLFRLDDLAEEYEVSMYKEDYLKYDKKLISILKKYGYYKEPKKS